MRAIHPGLLRQDWSPESESLTAFLTGFVTFGTGCQYVNALSTSWVSCLHSVAPGYLITMYQPVSENPGRRYLCSAVRHPLGTLFQSDSETSNSLPCPSIIFWRLYCFAERTIFHQHTLVTVSNCKSGRTLADRTYLLTCWSLRREHQEDVHVFMWHTICHCM